MSIVNENRIITKVIILSVNASLNPSFNPVPTLRRVIFSSVFSGFRSFLIVNNNIADTMYELPSIINAISNPKAAIRNPASKGPINLESWLVV